MRTRTLLVVALAFLLALLSTGWIVRGGKTTVPTRAEHHRDAVTPGRLPTARTPARSREARLTVSVTDPNNHPVVGAFIRVLPSLADVDSPHLASRELDLCEERRMTTGADGEVSITLPYNATRLVEVTKSGFATKVVRATAGHVAIRLRRSGSVSGQVFENSTRAGVPGVHLLLAASEGSEPPSQATSKPDGGFEFVGVAPGVHSLSVRMNGFMAYELPDIRVSAGQDTKIHVPMFHGLSIRGRVEDRRTRTNLASGRLLVRDPIHGVQEGEIGADGSFLVQGLTRTAGLMFQVLAEGYDPASRLPDVSPEFDPRTGKQTRLALVRVSPAPQVCGRVTDSSGNPVREALVVLGFGSVLKCLTGDDLEAAARSRTCRTLTDRDGRYSLTVPQLVRIGAGASGRMFVLHPSYAPFLGEFPPTGTGRDCDVALSNGTTLTVEATFGGAPVVDAEVRMKLVNDRFLGDSADVLKLVRSTPVTDDNGCVLIPHLCEGTWEVEVRSQDERLFAHDSVRIASQDDLLLRIQLGPAHSLSGVVVDQAGEAVQGARVTLSDGAAPHPYATTDAQGRFRFPFVGDDTQTVSVYVRGMSEIASTTVVPDQPKRISVDRLAQCDYVTGQVRDAQSRSLVPFGSWSMRVPTPHGTTGSNGQFLGGTFRIPVLRATQGTVRFAAPGYEHATFNAETFGADSSAVEVTLHGKSPSGGPSLARLRIKLPEQRTLAEVNCHDASTGRLLGRARCVTPSEYLFEYPQSAKLLVMVHALDGYLDAPSPCEVAVGHERQLALRLASDGGSLKGYLPGGAKAVIIRDCHGLEWDLPVAENGWFRSLSMAPGVYSIRTAIDSRGATVEVSAGTVSEVKLPH